MERDGVEDNERNRFWHTDQEGLGRTDWGAVSKRFVDLDLGEAIPPEIRHENGAEGPPSDRFNC